jgi:hypothetical protein
MRLRPALGLQTMHDMSFRLAFALIASSLVCACGDGDSGPGTDAAASADADLLAPDASVEPDGQPVTLTNHIIADDCAPNDGPALRLLLTGDSIGAQCHADGLGESVELRIYTRNITAPETIVFDTSNFVGNGSHCLGGAAPCLLSETGEIHFETFETDASATGTFLLRFQDDTTLQGRFDATWCTPDQPLFCG